VGTVERRRTARRATIVDLHHGPLVAGAAPRVVICTVPVMAEVEAHITGSVWKIEVAVGDTIGEGDVVAILESMKMEMPVEAEEAGVVREIVVVEGQAVSEGDTLVVLD
jgi:acetyl-CoA carboxylase biotin carboxyl carrier protein